MRCWRRGLHACSSENLCFVAKVKEEEDYDICLCRLHVKTGDVDGTNTLAGKGKEEGVYTSNCIFHCEYVQGRLAVYEGGENKL